MGSVLPPVPLFAATVLSSLLQSQSPWINPPLLGAPPARAEAAMAFDPGTQSWVLFGGATTTGVVGDTWIWSGAAWSPGNVGSQPLARRGHAMAGTAMVLFGGRSGATLLSDTWRWNAGWTQIGVSTAPSARADHAMAWDPVRQRVVLFGGQGVGGALSDTWEFDPAVSMWMQVSTANAPPARRDAAMAWDANRQELVLFGGIDGAPLGDTWTYDGSDWTALPGQGPSARSGHTVTSDMDTGGVALFGGTDGTAPLGDTWVLDRVGWRPISASPSPSARSQHAMAAGSNGVSVLFSGAGSSADTWLFTAGATALAEAFGSGCAGFSGEPALTVAPGSAPVPGTRFQLVVRNLGPNAIPIAGLGFDDQTFMGQALPLDLGFAGAPGCDLLIDLAEYVILNNVQGNAVFDLAVPAGAGLLGLDFYCQAASIEGFSIAVTNGIHGRVGGPPPTETFIDELFVTNAMRDPDASAGTWGGGSLMPAAVGGSGRLGSFDHQLGTMVNGVWVIDTDSFTVPADRTLTGQAETVTDGRFEFTDFVVPAGVEVRFEGSNPARILVRGRARIAGTVDASGIDQEIFSARDTISANLLPGQPGSAGGPGGGAGGRGGDRSDGQAGVPDINGFDGDDVQLPAGHAYTSSAPGTGGQGSAAWPAGGQSASVVYSVSFVFSGQIGAGGSGGGYTTPGTASSVVMPFPNGQTPALRGPSSPGGASFSVLPIPMGTSSEDHFAIGGSGGGGGGSHCYLALTGQLLDTWRAGAGGAGGGGVLAIRTGTDLVVETTGALEANGGAGAIFSALTLAALPNTSRAYPQPGGGGSGGSILLQSAGTLTRNGVLTAVGGAGGSVQGVSPLQIAAGADAGTGGDGLIRIEAGTTTGAGPASPQPVVGSLTDTDARSGARSRWYRLAANATPLRYEVEAVVFGQLMTFSDDPAISPLRVDDPNQPVVVRFQGGELDATGQVVSTSPWRSQVNPLGSGPSVSRDAPNAVRFDVVLRSDLDPNVRVTRVSIVTR